MKMNEKIDQQVLSKSISRVLKWTAIGFGMMLLIFILIAESRQLEIMEQNQILQLVKEDRSCQALGAQELQRAVAQANLEDKAEITDQAKQQYYTAMYLQCMQMNGRDIQ